MSRLLGYARVSRTEQDLNLQIDALIKEGCTEEHIFVDKASGAKTDRPGLDACLREAKKGDSLVVWRIDRLGRSLSHLVALVSDLKKKGISFKSVMDGAIDTTTPSGDLIFNIFASLAQFEREIIRERTFAGLAAARARGRKGGRRPIPPDHPKVLMVKTMNEDKSLSVSQICETLQISTATFYRYLAKGTSSS